MPDLFSSFTRPWTREETIRVLVGTFGGMATAFAIRLYWDRQHWPAPTTVMIATMMVVLRIAELLPDIRRNGLRVVVPYAILFAVFFTMMGIVEYRVMSP